MSRFLLFAGREDESDGGWFDFRAGFTTREEADAFLQEHVVPWPVSAPRYITPLPIRLGPPGGPAEEFYWWHLVDLESGDIVAHG